MHCRLLKFKRERHRGASEGVEVAISVLSQDEAEQVALQIVAKAPAKDRPCRRFVARLTAACSCCIRPSANAVLI